MIPLQTAFIESLVDRLIVRLRRLFLGTGDDEYAADYAEAAAGRFVTPDRTADGMEAILELNEVMTIIMISLFSLYLCWIITKVGLGLLQGSNAIFTGAKIIVGLGLLTINVQLVFSIFELSTKGVEALYYLRTLAEIDGIAGESLLTSVDISGALITAGTSVFFSFMAGLVLTASLYLRLVLLYGIVAFAPVIIVTWMAGKPVGLGGSLRAVFFPIPLVFGLYVIELINPGAQIPVFGGVVNSILIFGVIWASVKISAAGQLATGAVKGAAGAAALGATAYALGGSQMLKKAGIARSFGVGGIPLSRAVGGNEQGAGAGGGLSREDPREYTATARGGEGTPERGVVDDSMASEDEIWGKSWAEGVTPTTEKYADNTRWSSDKDLLQEMGPNQPGKGVWQSVHGAGAPDDLNPAHKNRRGDGTVRAMSTDRFRTEEEHEQFWGPEGDNWSPAPDAEEGVESEKRETILDDLF
jgi:hypothetical protein